MNETLYKIQKTPAETIRSQIMEIVGGVYGDMYDVEPNPDAKPINTDTSKAYYDGVINRDLVKPRPPRKENIAVRIPKHIEEEEIEEYLKTNVPEQHIGQPAPETQQENP